MLGCSGVTEAIKSQKYQDLGFDYLFAAFGVDTLGPWGPSALSPHRTMSKNLVDRLGDPQAGSYLAHSMLSWPQ